MSRYFISILLLCSCLFVEAQDKRIDVQPKDTVIHKEAYGLRIGIDLSRPTISFIESEFTGFELVGDYRISQKLYLAAEVGNENRDRQEDVYNFTTSGSYIKVGIDYNTYENWYGEHNLIYFGGRLAYSNFSQTLNNFQIFDSNRYWNPDGFVNGSTEATDFNGLTALWLEAVLGIKAELFSNIYLGGSVRLAGLINNNRPPNFNNLFIPGFNKVTDGSIFGVGYNFTLSYFIPLYKKAKTKKKEKPAPRPQRKKQ